jgi:dTDP-4-amino-4,6-dideoxygalactose transaminase
MAERPYIVFGSPILEQQDIDAVVRTLKSGWIGTGPQVNEFERRFAERVGAAHAVAVSSCTAALHLSLVASGVGPGDEVITTPLTFAATANAIIHTGATPVFVDCERDTMNLDPSQLEAAVTEHTRAIVPVHFAGRPCDMAAIHAVAKQRDLLVVEDAAHAIEARAREGKIGSLSPLTCFSFYVTKNLTTTEGGMVTTSSAALAAKIKTYALHGLSADAWSRFSDKGYKRYEVVFPGYKYNMTDMQAALGLSQLERVDAWLPQREALWARYDAAFRDLPVFLPAPAQPETLHARHLYTLLIDLERSALDRDQLMARLHERRIGTGVHYHGLHLQPYYSQRYGFKASEFPNASWISERTMSLPISAKLTAEDVDYIIHHVRDLLLHG